MRTNQSPLLGVKQTSETRALIVNFGYVADRSAHRGLYCNTEEYGMNHTLIAVILGGLLTLAGGWLGPWLLQKQRDAAEWKKRRAEKYEELIAVMHEHQQCLRKAEDRVVFRSVEHEGTSPMGRVEAICAVYFPEFTDQLNELERKSARYRLWMFEGRKLMENGDQNVAEKSQEAFAPYEQAYHDLLEALREYARTSLAPNSKSWFEKLLRR